MSTQVFLITFLLFGLCARTQAADVLFKVNEEVRAPFVLGNIAEKANISSRNNLGFSILSKNYKSDLFEVADDGTFSTKEAFDREALCDSAPRCVLTTSVGVVSSPTLFTKKVVDVEVTDINDQSPTFRTDFFPVRISEKSSVSWKSPLPVADDLDVNPLYKVQTYRLRPETQNTFDLVVNKVSNSDGYFDFSIQLRLLKELDRETTPTYDLFLVAVDGGNPANEAELPLRVIVEDENDNQPKFTKSRYSKEVKETTAVGTTLLRVSASDRDGGDNGRVSYELPNNVDRTVQELFAITADTGDITLRQSLEKEEGTSFEFKVRAFDHGSLAQSTETLVVISIADTVNDPPRINVSPLKGKNSTAQVLESAVVGTTVAFVEVTDTDSGNNGKANCSLNHPYFSMRTLTDVNEYTISLAKELDREKKSSHTVMIQCYDHGRPRLTSSVEMEIVVEDANDKEPIFERRRYNMHVKENQPAGKRVGNVVAVDKDVGVNGQLRYSVEPGVVEFEINDSNGYIYTAVNNLDRETKDRYQFTVYAFDMSSSPLTSSTTVVVTIEDENDVWPHFENSSYRFRLSETLEVDSQFGHVHATDNDLGLGGVVEYILVSSPLNPEPPFKVTRKDGTLHLTQPLDYEHTDSYKFVLTAFDLGRPPRNSSVEVEIEVLDENDNAPIIAFPSPDNLSVTLNLDVSPGHEVVRVIAHDNDSGENGRLSYSLTAPNSSNTQLFWINEDTGLVTLVSPLGPQDVRSYNVVISVHDNGEQQRATQALLQVNVVKRLEQSGKSDSNTTIVIIMVCITLCVAVIVLVTLCFIKYVDKRKFDAHKDEAHKPSLGSAKVGFSAPLTQGGGEAFLEKGLNASPAFQKQPFPPGSHSRNGSHKQTKKSVTFGSDIRAGETAPAPEMAGVSLDSGFSSLSSSSFAPNAGYRGSRKNSNSSPVAVSNQPTLTTFAPSGSRTHSPHVNGAEARGVEEDGAGDQVIDVALQKHNALVRSMRGNHRRPPCVGRQARASSGRDTDLCSSSSVETTDSGHGGSELDVSAVQANV